MRDRTEWENLYGELQAIEQNPGTSASGLSGGDLIAVSQPNEDEGLTNLPNLACDIFPTALTEVSILNPFDGDVTVQSDRPFLLAITSRLAREYEAYEHSGSSAWDLTIDVRKRPQWLKQAAVFSDQIHLEEALSATQGYADGV